MRSTLVFFIFFGGCSSPAPAPGTPDDIFEYVIERAEDVPALTAERIGAAQPFTMTRASLAARLAVTGIGRDFSASRLGGNARTAGIVFSEPAIFAQKGGGTPPAAPEPKVWTQSYTAPVNTTPALYTVSFTDQDPVNDRLYVYGGDAANPNFIAGLRNFYAGPPAEVWRLPISSPVNGSSIAIDDTGLRMFAVSGGGGGVGAAIWSVNNVDMTGWQVSWGQNTSVQWSSPWVDYATQNLYVGDEQDHLIVVSTSGAGGTLYTLGYNSAIHATPLLYNNLLWVGNDTGRVVIYDVSGGGLAPLGAFRFCQVTGTNVCTASHQVWGTPYLDVTNNRALIGVNHRLFQINGIDTLRTCIPAGTCTSSSRPMPGPGINSGRFQSSVLVDQNDAPYIYGARNNRLYRCPYAAADGVGPCSPNDNDNAVCAGSGPDVSYPHSSPLQLFGSTNVYIGDGGGFMNRMGPSASNLTTLSSYRAPGATSVDSSPIVDFFETPGSLYYGATLSSGGAYIQLSQSF